MSENINNDEIFVPSDFGLWWMMIANNDQYLGNALFRAFQEEFFKILKSRPNDENNQKLLERVEDISSVQEVLELTKEFGINTRTDFNRIVNEAKKAYFSERKN